MPDQAERDSPAIGMAAWNRDGVLVPGSTAVRLPVVTFAAPAEDQALARSAPPKDHRYAPRVTKLFNWGGAAHGDGDTGALANGCAAGRVLGHHVAVVGAVAVAGGGGHRGQPRALQRARRLVLGLPDDVRHAHGRGCRAAHADGDAGALANGCAAG